MIRTVVLRPSACQGERVPQHIVDRKAANMDIVTIFIGILEFVH
jgi:hypothetical protein